MEAKWYQARKCYRVWVPARLSEKGKNCRRFFETKEQAEKFIFETKRSGSVNAVGAGFERLGPGAFHTLVRFPIIRPHFVSLGARLFTDLRGLANSALLTDP